MKMHDLLDAHRKSVFQMNAIIRNNGKQSKKRNDLFQRIRKIEEEIAIRTYES